MLITLEFSIGIRVFTQLIKRRRRTFIDTIWEIPVQVGDIVTATSVKDEKPIKLRILSGFPSYEVERLK